MGDVLTAETREVAMPQPPPPAPAGAAARPSGLLRDADFLRLWGGETLSQVGSQVTAMALPLTAILLLGANARDVGILAAAQFAALPVVSMFAGVWLDRHRRRPALVLTNVARAALLTVVPVLYALDALTMPVLWLVALGTGALTAVYDVAYIVYLPTLVPRDQLVSANAKLEASYTVADVGGPGVGGLLVEALRAPFAIVADIATYLLAGLLSARIRKPEPSPAQPDDPEGTWVSIRRGFAVTLTDRVLRPVAVQSALFNLFSQAILTLYLLHGVRNLGLSSGLLGLLLAVGASGGVVGTLVARRTAARLGEGATMVWSMALASAALGLLPAAEGSRGTVVAVLAAGLVLHGIGLAIFNVYSFTVRALVIPSEVLGRVTATWRVITNGTLPLGGLLGGVLGHAFGLRAGMAVPAALLVACAVWFVLTPIRRHDDFTRIAAGAG